MGKIQLLQLLYEELLEENRKSEFIHYTNFISLYGILKKGKILAKDYTVKSSSKRDNLEIATLRRSVDHSYKKTKNIDPLTSNADGVKIYLLDKNIISSVRGITKNPIAEYVKFNKYALEEDLSEFIYKWLKGKKISKESLKEFLKIEIYAIKEKGFTPEEIRKMKADNEALKDLFKNFYTLTGRKADDFHLRADLNYLLKSYAYIEFSSSLGREGEERFLFKNIKNKETETGIPTLPKYMKIRIYRVPTPEEIEVMSIEEYSVGRIESIKEFYDLILKNKDLFLKDESFKKFVENIKLAMVESGQLNEEMAIRSEVVHLTNLYALMGILRDGFISPTRYDIDSVSDSENPSPIYKSSITNKREIATLRRSVDRGYSALKRKDEGKWREKLDTLTERAKDVKIYLFNRNISSKLRGVTKKPIAEYNKQALISFNKGVDSVYMALHPANQNLDFFMLKKKMKKIGKELGEYCNENKIFYLKDSDAIVREKMDNLAKELNLDLSKIDKERDLYGRVFYLINNIVFLHTSSETSREGEERIVFKKEGTEGIPVSPDFMKIKIAEEPTEEDVRKIFEHLKFLDTIIYVMEEARSNLIKYEKSFLVDRNYRKLVGLFDKIIEEEKAKLKKAKKYENKRSI